MAETESGTAGPVQGVSAEGVRTAVGEEIGRRLPDADQYIANRAREAVAAELGERDSLASVGWALAKGAAYAAAFLLVVHLAEKLEQGAAEQKPFNT